MLIFHVGAYERNSIYVPSQRKQVHNELAVESIVRKRVVEGKSEYINLDTTYDLILL